MRISIVGMFVKDLEGAKKFFMDYFGAQEHAVYEEDNGFKSYILKFDEGPKLELMTKRDRGPAQGPQPYRLCAYLHQGGQPGEAGRDHREVPRCGLRDPL